VHAGGAQLLDHLAIVRLGEELGDALRHDRPHVGHLLQRIDVGCDQRVEIAEVACQITRGGLADVADAEREDEAGQRGAAALFDRHQQVLRRLLAHALEVGEREHAEAVQIDRRLHDRRIDELVDQLVAQALDVHRAPAGKMQQCLLALRRAEQPAGTARHRLVLATHHVRAAHRAGGKLVQQHEARRLAAAALQHRRDDFGDHVAGAAHDHPVADAHVLAVDLVLVVQRGVGDGDAANEDRLQARHRGQRAGTADLHLDVAQQRDRLLRRILVRHRPARLAGDETEALLQRERVDLVHHAVDVEGQRVAQRAHAFMERRQPGRATHLRAVLAHRQAEGRERVEHLGVGRG
jgi:hypothetical protein